MRSLEVCLVQCRAASSWINEPIGPYWLRLEFDWPMPLNLLWVSDGWEMNLQFRARLSWMCSEPCCESMCRRRSTLRWKAREQRWHWNGLKPVCFRLWVMRFDDWEKAFPQTRHLCGFSPKYISRIRFIPQQSSTRYEMRSISWERRSAYVSMSLMLMRSIGLASLPFFLLHSILNCCIFNKNLINVSNGPSISPEKDWHLVNSIIDFVSKARRRKLTSIYP